MLYADDIKFLEEENMKGTKALVRILSGIGAVAVVIGLLLIVSGLADSDFVTAGSGASIFVGGFLIYAVNEIIQLLSAIKEKLEKK